MLLASCGETYNFNYNENPEEIKEIKILSVVFEDGQYTDKTEELLVTIEEEAKQKFLDELSKLEFSRYVIGDPMSVGDGIVIKIIFKDNSYHLITYYWTDIYNSKGEDRSWVAVSCSEDEFLDFVNEYIE